MTPRQLRPSDTYTEKRIALEPEQKRAIGWAEDEIANDPDHVKWRRRTTRGTTLDFLAADTGFAIEYDSRPAVILLCDLVDLRYAAGI